MATTQDQQLDAHIPSILRDPALLIQSVPPTTGNCPTIFVGIVDGTSYTHEMWDMHKNLLAALFDITDPNCIGEIKIGSIFRNSVDGANLHQQFKNATDVINQKMITHLRIVGLGIGSSPSVTDALESLIREWKIDSTTKEVQFIALGESPDFHYLNFCKSLCMKKICKLIQYYNTMDYNEYGQLDLSTSPIFKLASVVASLVSQC